MAALNSDFAPYTSPALVISVIKRFRQHTLPDVLSVQELIRIDVPEGSATRVQQALRFLQLIDEDLRLTPEFRRIGQASAAEYPELFAEILRRAYALVFKNTDPTYANDDDLEDAFRYYEPRAQRRRMVALFLAFAKEAGIVSEDRSLGRQTVTSQRATNKKPSGMSPPKTSNGTNWLENKPLKPVQPDLFDTETSPLPSRAIQQSSKHQQYELLLGFFEKLPDNKQWTDFDRNRWLQAFTLTLDLEIDRVSENTNQKGSTAEHFAELPLQQN